MRYSEAPDDIRVQHIAYIKTRWEELAGLERKWIDSAHQYLFLTGSGSAVATLTFMGATVQAQKPITTTMVLMLAMFVLSVLSVGLAKAYQYYYVRNIYKLWRDNTAKYYENALGWMELNTTDAALSADSKLGEIVAWSSFMLIVIGIGIGFKALEGENKHGIPVEPQAPKSTVESTSSPSLTYPTCISDQGSGGSYRDLTGLSSSPATD